MHLYISRYQQRNKKWSHVNWPETFTHMISSEQIRHSSKLMKQAIFETEQRCWSHDCSLGKDASNNILTSRL
jgi:hypothetical protein